VTIFNRNESIEKRSIRREDPNPPTNMEKGNVRSINQRKAKLFIPKSETETTC